MKKQTYPNPQGKGISQSIGFLQELETGLSILPLKDDSRERIVEDYISSLVALSCSFKFKPVVGKKYYMYLMNKKWMLSLVAPEQGGSTIFEKFLAFCRLREDTTWELKFVNGHELGVSLFEDEICILKDNKLDWKNGISPDNLRKFFSKSGLGRYRKDLGYYQNALNFTLGKVIAFRTERILEIADKFEKTNLIE